MSCATLGCQAEPQIKLWNSLERPVCAVALLVLIPDIRSHCFNFPDGSFLGRTEYGKAARANILGSWNSSRCVLISCSSPFSFHWQFLCVNKSNSAASLHALKVHYSLRPCMLNIIVETDLWFGVIRNT